MKFILKAAAACATALVGGATEPEITTGSDTEQRWNWHLQNTDIVQGYPAFGANYSGPFSLPNGGETRESVSLDLMVGARLWHGAEAHLDGLMWQGFGIGNTRGIDGFPNGEAFRLGTSIPNVNLARAFIRQTIGLGGDQENVEDDAYNLAGKRDISRLTLTVGRFSAKDIFDGNSYANDPRTQFLNWGLMANQAWDYSADALGYMSGFAAELNLPDWAFRYGFFQMPRVSNGTALDTRFLQAWGMVSEVERRFAINERPGAVRLLAYLNQARMGSYQAALDDPARPADVAATRGGDRDKYGFGLNAEQEIVKNIGVFTRLGWSDGRNEGWTFSDVDYTINGGISVNGAFWYRPNDVWGTAAVFNGLSGVHQRYFAAGGTGVLIGDGALRYGWEKILETYYDFEIWKTIHAAVDYQFVTDPGFNQDRGPISIFAARIHWSY